MFQCAIFDLSLRNRSKWTSFTGPECTFCYEWGPNGHHSLGQNSPFDTTKVLPDTFDCASWHHFVLWSTPLCKRDMFQCTGSDKLIPKRSNRQPWRGQFHILIRNRPNLACSTGLDFTFLIRNRTNLIHFTEPDLSFPCYIGPTWHVSVCHIRPFATK